HHRDSHYFPTRRSSDLSKAAIVTTAALRRMRKPETRGKLPNMIPDEPPETKSAARLLYGFFRSRQAAPLHGRGVVLLEVLDAFGGDRQARIVSRAKEFLLREKPDRELEVFARAA